MTQECYYCQKIGTTIEHAPPKCLFPEYKIFNRDYRINLITVKSCEEHNCEKSGSDERLRQILVASPFNNSLGISLTSEKWKRAFERNPKSLNDFIEGGNLIQYKLDEDSGYQDGLAISRNCDELDESLKRICAALFYSETGLKLLGKADVLAGFTLYHDIEMQRESEAAIENTRNYYSSKPKKGENHEVFYFHYEYSESTAIFYLVFYGYNEVVVRFRRE